MLTLEDIRTTLGWDPWHFWGFYHPEKAPKVGPQKGGGACDDIVYEFNYQDGDSAGRSNIVDKIIYVHDTLASYLRYDVGLQYREERVQWPNFVVNSLRPNRKAQADGRWVGFNTERVHVESIGYLRRDLIELGAVSFVDYNNDGLNDEFIVTVPTTVTDPSQIVVYFTEDDIPSRTSDDLFNIRYKVSPVRVTIADGVATIKGAAWLLGKPKIYEYQIRGQALDPTVLSNFALELNVFREWMDPNGTSTNDSQAVLTWESVPGELQGFCCGDPASTGSVLARVGIRDAKNGIVYLGQSAYDSISGTWQSVISGTCRPPDSVLIRYRAGVPLTSPWRQVLIPFIVAELPRRLCACDTANRALYEWQFDLARSGGSGSEDYAYTPEVKLRNPFGTRRGHVMAWNYIDPIINNGSVRL